MQHLILYSSKYVVAIAQRVHGIANRWHFDREITFQQALSNCGVHVLNGHATDSKRKAFPHASLNIRVEDKVEHRKALGVGSSNIEALLTRARDLGHGIPRIRWLGSGGISISTTWPKQAL